MVAINDMLYVDGGVSSTQTVGHLRMQGRRSFPSRSCKFSLSGR